MDPLFSLYLRLAVAIDPRDVSRGRASKKRPAVVAERLLQRVRLRQVAVALEPLPVAERGAERGRTRPCAPSVVWSSP